MGVTLGLKEADDRYQRNKEQAGRDPERTNFNLFLYAYVLSRRCVAPQPACCDIHRP